MLHNDNKDMFDDVCDCGYEDTNDGIEFSDPSHDKDSHSVIMRLAAPHTPSGEESSDWTPKRRSIRHPKVRNHGEGPY